MPPRPAEDVHYKQCLIVAVAGRDQQDSITEQKRRSEVVANASR